MKMKENFVKDVLVPLLTALTAITALVLSASSNQSQIQLQERLGELDFQMREQEGLREERESIQGLHLKVYEVVVGSIKEENLQQQKAAEAVVLSLVKDEDLKSDFLQVLKQGGLEPIQERVEQIQAEAEVFDEDEKRAT